MTNAPSVADLARRIGDLEQTRDALQEEIREAHGVLKDLRNEIKTARELVPLLTDEAFSAEVTKQVEELGAATKTAMDTAVERVFKKFDELQAMLMGEDRISRRKGRTPIPDALRAYLDTQDRTPGPTP
ncbi:hypothetical protein [Streptomyces sp. STCH 565 A]|uniref:hypothetical protein n=1 Tax=Streptomyces sp. STCH 565 A TaxID=2950532 RepID=UPI002074E91C|nr:hypothetical protein [Streptomyces sp. STCH 565 A]MCM8550045.1 hypothetical protein [Streptomyces sp. STCH 565 A]